MRFNDLKFALMSFTDSPESDWYSPMYLLVRYLTVSADLPTCFPPITTSFTERSKAAAAEAAAVAAGPSIREVEEGLSRLLLLLWPYLSREQSSLEQRMELTRTRGGMTDQLCRGLNHFGEEFPLPPPPLLLLPLPLLLLLLSAVAAVTLWTWEIFGSRPKEVDGPRGRQKERRLNDSSSSSN